MKSKRRDKKCNIGADYSRPGRCLRNLHPYSQPPRFLFLLGKHADPLWVQEFKTLTVAHLVPAIRGQNANTRRHVLDVVDYVALRNQVSGMFPAIALCEVARGASLHWNYIAAAGLADDYPALQRLTAEFGALWNDIFSFEKEVINDRSDFNHVSILLLKFGGNSVRWRGGSSGDRAPAVRRLPAIAPAVARHRRHPR
ncbi:terpene synthase family protein [Nocardia africana]|uniref:Terpene synthase family protein n=1 Tax=Nocardia africana TaxID=134964 RepID=A0ABW6NU97_9NOCA